MTADYIARLRAGTVTPADLDAAADGWERALRALEWVAAHGETGAASGYLCAQVARKAVTP